MPSKNFVSTLSYKEVLFQVLLHGVVFVFYSYDRRNPQVESYQVVFFLTYAVAALIINYLLLPRFLYQKKHLQFVGWTIMVIAVVIFVEEAVIEQIYFPDTRGQRFLGVFFSLWGVLPVITVLSGFKFAWDAVMKQREVDELKATIQESELQFLKSQINPHFLFNNLNNLYSYAIDYSPQTPEIILKLSSVLRYMLYECKEKFVSLTKEIEQLENFTQLSQLQIEERGVVSFSAQVYQPDYQIAPLILIVFIENAFKHSQASQSENILIDITVQLSEDGALEFSCKNNFQSVANTDNLAQGIGLENVKKRLQLLYPNAHQLTIDETENQYEVYLSMQLKRLNKEKMVYQHTT
ncbi:sensor histidine kinase [Tunicatimonas pelagia]|uniref:sensor histidine kinase n=1 Tax=Tunicatimonas pelagia TaxID=931531 RepID=UPI0026658138|nr:histidine kinase [Tunicatimonas pelagia]WKN44130.1 histidine kinase [Tunicatimonas pelagia]